MILARVEDDRKDSLPDGITGAKIIKHLSDPMVWMFGQ